MPSLQSSEKVTPWSIEGADGEPILGDMHQPEGEPSGVVVVAHGFKGYKDYGMFPRIAATMAGRGFIAHRFNFSHSGMTNDTETFARPDLFERDTWNRQVADVRAVIAAIDAGVLGGRGLPYVLFGHSRGGVTVLLAAGRHAGELNPAGIATAAAPSFCNALSPDQQKEILDLGFIVSPSSRTGQDLRIGKAFLVEMQADPEGHDLLRQAARITCPVLIVHGENDPTVPALCAEQIAAAIGDRARVEIVAAADHVFNTPNPLPDDAKPSPQLQRLLDQLGAFAGECVNMRP